MTAVLRGGKRWRLRNTSRGRSLVKRQTRWLLFTFYAISGCPLWLWKNKMAEVYCHIIHFYMGWKNVLQFLKVWLCPVFVAAAGKSSEEGGRHFFPLHFLPVGVLFPSKCTQAPIHGARAVVCSDLLRYLLIPSDWLKHWRRMAKALSKMGMARDPTFFTATSCCLALSVLSAEHKSQSRHRY